MNRRGLGMVAAFVIAALLVSLGVPGMAKEEKWNEIWELLATDRDGAHLAEVAQQAVLSFAELGPELLQQLDPSKALFYCPAPGCGSAVLLVPAKALSSVDQAGQLARAYNQGRALGLLGVRGDLLIPGVSGFFLLIPQPNGSVALLREGGEEVGGLVAMHVWKFGATPQPIPLPRPADNLLLPPWPQAYEVQAPVVEVGQAAEGELILRIGQTLRAGIFSGVILFGATPQPIP